MFSPSFCSCDPSYISSPKGSGYLISSLCFLPVCKPESPSPGSYQTSVLQRLSVCSLACPKVNLTVLFILRDETGGIGIGKDQPVCSFICLFAACQYLAQHCEGAPDFSPNGTCLSVLPKKNQSPCLRLYEPAYHPPLRHMQFHPAPISQIICVIKNCEKRLWMRGWRHGNCPECIPREQSDGGDRGGEEEELGDRRKMDNKELGWKKIGRVMAILKKEINIFCFFVLLLFVLFGVLYNRLEKGSAWSNLQILYTFYIYACWLPRNSKN